MDLFSPTFKANPFPTYTWLRENEPVYAHVAPYGARIWYITRYEDVVEVLKDNDRFTKVPPHHKHEDAVDAGNVYRMINRNMLFADPPDHTRLRHLISKAFTPKRIQALQPQIETIAADLINRFETDQPIDLIDRYAFPLPVQVIMALLGIPAEDQIAVIDWSKAIIAPGRHGISLKQRKQKVRQFVDYLNRLFELRQATPQDDLISALVQVEEAGDRLNTAELSSMVALLFVTGHETVVNLIGNGMLLLLQNRAWADRIRTEPDVTDAVVEEILRLDGPVETSTTRWARRDFDFYGRQIQAGDTVRVVLSSANRDTAEFDQPAAFRPERYVEGKPPHLAFGLGIHYCIGAPLARLEGRIAFQAILNRYPNLTLAEPAEDLKWHTGVIFRGLKCLPVTVSSRS